MYMNDEQPATARQNHYYGEPILYELHNTVFEWEAHLILLRNVAQQRAVKTSPSGAAVI